MAQGARWTGALVQPLVWSACANIMSVSRSSKEASVTFLQKHFLHRCPVSCSVEASVLRVLAKLLLVIEVFCLEEGLLCLTS